MTKQLKKRAADWYEWACGWLPMFRRTHDAILQTAERGFSNQFAFLRRSHHEEIAETLKLIDGICQRAAKIDFTRGPGEYYTMHLALDPRFYCGVQWDEQKLLARHVAYRVEAEIANSKFVEKAWDNYRKAVA